LEVVENEFIWRNFEVTRGSKLEQKLALRKNIFFKKKVVETAP
jgi:hypothetical protein